jgi:lipid II:glycine glycyltransferase (peptidoglycan interpeptide bridge formation enzyme)
MSELNYTLPPDSWDKQLLMRGGHFLQSRVWGEFQQALGRKPVWASGEDWQWLGAAWRGRGVNYLYVPYGPTIAADASGSLSSLQRAGRELGVDFVRCEPMGRPVDDRRLRRFEAVQPQHTWVLDLTKSEEELRSGLNSGHRNLINTAAKRGLSFRSEKDSGAVESFLPMLADTYRRSGIKAHPDSYYRQLASTLVAADAATFYFADYQGQPVAAALIYDFGPTRYYAHAVANQQLNRELKAAAPLLWQMILEAKQQGRERFDFWGIAPTDEPSHPWAGISKFKRAFGGEQLTLQGTWDLPLKPLKYQAYRLAKRVLPL